MPADPGAGLTPKEKLPTTKDGIGHVAPSFTDKPRFNTLVLRPEYRISLRLGEIENLFPWPINTLAGRGARLQVLGLFYWPLNHRVALGTTAKPALAAPIAENQDGAKFAWKYFKEKFCGNGNDAAGETELKKRLKEWVVQRMNGTASGGPGGELPLPPVEGEAASEAKGHFAKIRLPGGWCMLTPLNGGGSAADYNADTSISGLGMYDSKYAHETNCYNVNPALGKIPLVATVEKLDSATNQWKPAKDVYVSFQLLKPADLPAFDTARGCHQQLNRPTLHGSSWNSTHPNPKTITAGAGPKYFTELWEKYEKDDDTPQVNNAHEKCGGKRKSGDQTDGSDVKDILFQMGEVAGFSKAHSAPPAGMLDAGAAARTDPPADKLFKTVEPADVDHPHAVKSKTNDHGEAGVIFMPSRCGGDRYRLRAYISDDGGGFKSKGDDFKAVRVDTGTFVVWRNARISRWCRQPIDPANLLRKMANQYFSVADTFALQDVDLKRWAELFGGYDRDKTWIGLPTVSLDTVSDGLAGSDYDGIRPSLARGFCELDADPGFQTDMTQIEWKAAVDIGYADAKRYQDNWGSAREKKIDLDVLCFRDGGSTSVLTDGLSMAAGFCCPTLGSFAFDERNHTKNANGPKLLRHPTAATAQQYRAALDTLIDQYFLYGFARSLAANGYLPGTTFIQAMSETNIEGEPGYATGALGYALHYNVAYVVRGQAEYRRKIGGTLEPKAKFGNTPNFQRSVMCGYTKTAIHELGHCLFKVHAPGLSGSSPAGGMKAERHDCWGDQLLSANAADSNKVTSEPKYSTCLMSYRNAEGYFCSRCLFELRGWKIWENGAIAEMTRKDVDAPPSPVTYGAETTLPTAPTNLSATAGNAQVVLTWNAVAGAASYLIKRGDSSGGGYSVAGEYVAGTTYTDATVTNEKTYYYVVSAVNARGESPNSAEVNASPATPPSPPTGLTAARGDTTVSLSWTASARATTYKVKRSTTSGGAGAVIWSGAATNFNDTGLTNLTAYYYTVSAKNVGGESAASAEASATPRKSGAGAAIQRFFGKKV